MNTLTFPVSFAPKAQPLFAKTIAFVHNELALRAAMRELRRMDDRTLADIGICRGEIKDAVLGRRKAK